MAPANSFDRSLKQRRDALEEANRVRSHRAELKKELKAGRKGLEDVLVDPDCSTAKVFDMLLALPKIGRIKVNRVIVRARISPSKTIGGMSPRQRLDLRRELERVSPGTPVERFHRQATTLKGGAA